MRHFVTLGFFALIIATTYLARASHTRPRLGQTVYILLAIVGIAIALDITGSLTSTQPDHMWSLTMRSLGIIGMLTLFSRALRERIASFLPINPASAWHLFVLSAVILFGTHSLAGMFSPETPEFSFRLSELLAQNGLFVVIALIGAGLFGDRPLRLALYHLGIFTVTRKTLKTAAIATIGIYGLVFVCATAVVLFEVYVLGHTIEELSGRPPTTVQALFETLDIHTILGIAALVAVGEEFLFRGMLQPIVGLLPTAFLFTIVHLPQNAFDPLSIVLFAPALGLGLLRKYADTTTAILSHALYDAGLLLLVWLGTNVGRWIAIIP